MYVQLLLAAALASTASESSPANAGVEPDPAQTTQTIHWKVRGMSHALDVEKTEAGDLALVGRDGEYLRSIVGPMMSTLQRKTWQGEAGTYRTLRISTETQGPYPFDLVQWIDQSGQAGSVLRQMLESSTCDFNGKCGAPAGRWPTRPQCPSPAALSAYDGGFLEMSRLLVDAQCFTEEQVRVQPEGFWIDGFDGERITMAIQREHCQESTSACDGRVSFVSMTPPRAWNRWLENAAAGQGFLPRALATAHNAGPVKPPPSNDPGATAAAEATAPPPEAPPPAEVKPAPEADATLPAPPPDNGPTTQP